MADNTPVYQYAGGSSYDIIGTDDVSGVKFQRIKLDIGGDGASVPLVPGQKTMAGGLPVTIASDQSGIPVTVTAGTTVVTGTVAVQPNKASNVGIATIPASGSSVIFAATNPARMGLAVYNGGASVLWLKLGSPITTNNFTIQIAPLGYYEVPFNYTGIVYGAWAQPISGFACVSEFAP